MSKLSRGQKGEDIVNKRLDSLKVHHHLFSDVTFINKNSEMSHQIDHLLVHPHGVFVFETKNYYGDVFYKSGDWSRKIDGKPKTMNDPLRQNKSHAITVYKSLKGKYEVIPCVVFVQNNAPYTGDENVINLNDLELFIDSYPFKHKLRDDTIDKIADEIKKNIKDVSKQDHLENISYLKAVKTELRKEKEFAITNGVCPRCQHKMIIKGNHFKCSNCDYKFDL